MPPLAPDIDARSGPGDPRAAELLDVVRGLVAEVHTHDRAPPAVTLEADIDRDLGLDSLARVELALRVERRLGLHLPERALGGAATVADLLAALQAAQPSPGAAPDTPHAALPPGTPAPASTATLTEVLRWHAARTPERVHVVFTSGEEETARLTYGALEASAAALAGGLVARGMQPGDRVALMLPTGAAFLAAFHAVLRAGAIPVPLYPPASPARIADHLARGAGILRNCGARLLLAPPDVRTYARLLRTHAPDVKDVIDPAVLGDSPGAAEPRAATDVALLQYTSGSTGNPKGVVLTHANLLANIRAMGAVVRLAPDDVFVSWLPLYHDMGLIGAWLGSLHFGIPLVLMSPLAFLQRPQRWLHCIARYRGTLSGGPNFAYELCVTRLTDRDVEDVDLASWRYAFNGAEPVSASTLQRFAARYARRGLDVRALAPVYGLAECSVGLAFTPPQRGAAIDRIDRAAFLASGHALPARGHGAAMAVVSCGPALPGHAVRIVDAHGTALPERREGRIQFRGPSAAGGYFRNEAATRALVDDGWRDTGDLGYVAGGELYPTGRMKDLVIRAGRHFHPDELEEAVGRLPGIRQGCVAVFGAADPLSGTEALVIVAETHETSPARRSALRAAINALAVDLVGAPAERVLLAPPHTVLKTSSGKVRRAETRLLYERGMLTAGPLARAARHARIGAARAVAVARAAVRNAGELAYAGYAWAALALVAAVAAPVLALPLPLAHRQAVARACARVLLHATGLYPTVSGLAHVPRDARCIVVANHASYLDAIVLGAVLPAGLRFVAKRGLAEHALLRFAFRATGTVLVESTETERGIEAADALLVAARSGQGLVLFPEGTFRRAPGVLPFRLGAFVTAARTGLPVVPVALRGTRSALPADTWRPRRTPLAVTMEEPLRPTDAGFAVAVALRDAAREAIALRCGEGDASC